MTEKMTKSFPIFDCDAHVNDPLEIWSEYVPESQKELVHNSYWRDDTTAMTNGDQWSFGGGGGLFQGSYNPICIAGPQMNKKILRRIQGMTPLTEEQRVYLEHQGAYDAIARTREMDLMGIDQVLVIPTMMIMNFPFVENADGAKAFCEAYNNWLTDWCAEVPERLYGAAMLPLQSPSYTAAEIRRVADLGHPVGLIRPIDARGAYPNNIVPDDDPFAAFFGGGGEVFDEVFKTFEETGVCLGMHTFPAGPWPSGSRGSGPGTLVSPGEYLGMAGVDTQTLSFIYEMQTWLAQVLLGGVLDRYPNLKMLVFESNSQWLPFMLEHCDRLFKLYRNERKLRGEAAAVGSVLRAVRDQLRERRSADDAPVGGVRGHRHLGFRRLPPRRRRLVERDPRDAGGRRARSGAGEAHGRERPPPLRHRAEDVRHRGGRSDRPARLVPRRSGARRVGHDGRGPSPSRRSARRARRRQRGPVQRDRTPLRPRRELASVLAHTLSPRTSLRRSARPSRTPPPSRAGAS